MGFDRRDSGVGDYQREGMGFVSVRDMIFLLLQLSLMQGVGRKSLKGEGRE